jgi:hypothetical protein
MPAQSRVMPVRTRPAAVRMATSASGMGEAFQSS